MISKKILNALTKEQLIFLINQYQHMEFIISEICVNESKQHIPSEQAVEEIRKELRNCNFPFSTSTEEFISLLDYKMGKITLDEYKEKIGIG